MTPIQIFIYIALAVLGSILQAAQTQQQQNTSGVRSQRQEGGDNSQAFVIGKYGVAGQFEYWLDWGEDGQTPNAYHSEVYSVGDLRFNGFTGLYFNGSMGTLLYGEPHAELGIPVAEARRNGKDHLWIKFYDGSQTAADAMLVARSAGSTRPWTAEMVFVDTPYVVVTALYNRDVFTGIPKYLFEVQGIDLYDMSQDSSVGGDGPQRYNDPTTWAYSDDPIVAASNIFLGIRYQGSWMYGGQTITPEQLPAANWIAQINKSKARGFKCGYEIVCGEEQPHAVIGELLMAAAARCAEIGGFYKVLVAEPDEPVRSFTDEDLVIDDEDELDPFPGLEATVNVISSTYPEPAEAYGMKQAPSRFDAGLEAEDGGRRLPKPIAYKAVPYGDQVQQLDMLAITEARRFRTHINTMPPEWWELEPLDVEAWTSARNGYAAKRFLITAVDDLADGLVVVSRRETEPDDYGWSPEDLLPSTISPLGIILPAPQPMTGWNIAGYAFPDADGRDRQVGAQVFFAEGLVDVRAVRVQIREAFGGNGTVFDGESPYDVTELVPSRSVGWASAIANANYEGRGIYVPFSGRQTEWSAWISFSTPDVRTGPGDLTDELNDARAWATRTIEQMQADRSRAIAQMADALAGRAVDLQTYRQEIAAQFQDTVAAYTLEVTAVASDVGALVVRAEQLEATVEDPETGLAATAAALSTLTASVNAEFEATAEAITAVESSIGQVLAGGYISIQAVAAPSGWDVRAAFAIKGSSGGEFVQVGLYMDAKSDGTSRIVLDADELVTTGTQRSVSGNSFINWNTGAQRMGG